MDNLFRINIITPESTLYDGEASSLIAPTEMGYIGILANHAPLITILGPGTITIKGPSASPVILENKSKGFLKVLRNNAILLLGA